MGAVGIDTAKGTTQRAVQRGRNEEVGWHLDCYPCGHGTAVWERAGKVNLKKSVDIVTQMHYRTSGTGHKSG